MLPQDRAASSPSPSPCTPCPRCCAPEQTEKHVSHIVKHKINKQIEEKSCLTSSSKLWRLRLSKSESRVSSLMMNCTWGAFQSTEVMMLMMLMTMMMLMMMMNCTWGAFQSTKVMMQEDILSDLAFISMKGWEESTFVAWTSWSQCRSLMALFWSSPTARRLEISFIASSPSSSSLSSLSPS